MNRREFSAVVRSRVRSCEWPGCTTRTTEAAHLRHAGMGGSKSHDPANGIALCRFHHDLFDGRTHKGLRVEVAALLREVVRLRGGYPSDSYEGTPV